MVLNSGLDVIHRVSNSGAYITVITTSSVLGVGAGLVSTCSVFGVGAGVVVTASSVFGVGAGVGQPTHLVQIVEVNVL